jgi:hypothetical protein
LQPKFGRGFPAQPIGHWSRGNGPN